MDLFSLLPGGDLPYAAAFSKSQTKGEVASPRAHTRRTSVVPLFFFKGEEGRARSRPGEESTELESRDWRAGPADCAADCRLFPVAYADSYRLFCYDRRGRATGAADGDITRRGVSRALQRSSPSPLRGSHATASLELEGTSAAPRPGLPRPGFRRQARPTSRRLHGTSSRLSPSGGGQCFKDSSTCSLAMTVAATMAQEGRPKLLPCRRNPLFQNGRKAECETAKGD